jgi:hypothetical protein
MAYFTTPKIIVFFGKQNKTRSIIPAQSISGAKPLKALVVLNSAQYFPGRQTIIVGKYFFINDLVF